MSQPNPPYPTDGTQPPPPPVAPPKKKKRIFLWVFLAIQLLFLIWIIAGIASAGGDATDCGSLSQEACNDASDVGTGIGVFLIIVLWFFVDFFVGLGYIIYRLARRP